MKIAATASVVACTACLMATSERAECLPRIGGHVEGGFGTDIVRRMASDRTAAAMASAGACMVVLPNVRIALEATVTGGGEFGTAYVPEAPHPGTRSLRTLLAGVEITRGRALGSPFVFAGAGIGRMTLKDASNGQPPMYAPGPLPRDRTAFAAGAGLGYRFLGGPYVTGWQLGVRTHAILHAGMLSAWAGCVTLGLAY